MKEAEWKKLYGVVTSGGDPCYECSNCGYQEVIGIEQKNKQLPNECPNCGSKMIKYISSIIIY